MVNDEEEIEFRGRDKFVPTDLTVTATVKPRMVYLSHVTNWENDRYATRLQFMRLAVSQLSILVREF